MAKQQRKKKQATPRPYAPENHLIEDTKTAPTERYPDVFSVHTIGKVSAVNAAEPQCFDIVSAGKANLRIEVWNERTIRFRSSVGPAGRDFSYARREDARPSFAKTALKEGRSVFTITTDLLKIEVTKATGKVTVTDKKTKAKVHEYAKEFYGRSTLKNGLEQVRIQLKTDKSEAIYGMGDKGWDTNLQGSYWANYNEDAFAFGRDRKTNYRSIPFYYGLKDGVAYGLFLDNTYKTHFDFNSSGDKLTSIWADGGEMDYYFFFGPALDTVAAEYHWLTGVPELPPLWAMGFHQCRWSYYPESRVRELATTFREKKIPCDAIYLDIDYMDGYRCFTWNKTHFPDPKGMIADLKEDGFHTVVMIDPGIRVDPDYHVYRDGSENDAWCKRADGSDMVGPVWPQECVWPDYTKPEVRSWWGPLYRELYNEQGVSGFWNDMNEPAMFKVNSLTFPDDVRHDYDGAPTHHKKAHNIYGMQMTRASYNGLKALQPAKRPFLLGRANFSGGQRHAALWTGDNIASWEHLQIANRQCLRMAISGYSMVGTDIGGFVDDPSPELLTRWLQLAVFHPFMRIHSMGNNADGAAEAEADAVKEAEKLNRQDQEPWVHGKPHTKYNRRAIEMRYQLLPYLYTGFRRHVKTGIPVIRNLFFYDQQDPLCQKFGDQFFYGEDLLVCPVLKEGAKTLQVYLPKGEWYSFWTGDRHTGGQKLRVKVKADRIPIFVRAGAVLPTVDVVQHTRAMQQLDNIELSVFAANRGESQLYWDAGEGYGHEAGQYTERTYTVHRKGHTVALRQSKKGDFNTNFRTAEVRFVGLTKPPTKVTVDGKKINSGIHYGKRAVVVNVPFEFSEIVIA